MNAESVKICGLSDRASIDAALSVGANHLGFVFYPPSPRHLSPEDAGSLARAVPPGVHRVGLFVDPISADIQHAKAVAGLTMIQLHGGESPDRVAEIRQLTGLPVMKALRVSEVDDLQAVRAYAPVADWILFDAKPPKTESALPGGNGLSFDWTLLRGFQAAIPWMLSGGLDAENVAEAIRTTGARAVDVSSGVESKPGVKDPMRIQAFLRAARGR